jgi:parallel beta-helix repeat protein
VSRRKQSGRSWPAVVAAAAVFGLLGSMPVTLGLLHVHLSPVAATSSHGVTLLPAPGGPAPVRLPRVAQPIDAGQPPASLPSVDAAREAAAVSAEDRRIRTMLHDAVRIYQPEVIPVRGSLPTLILTATSHPYTAADLVQYGALVMLKNKSALLLDNLFVSANARLSLGGSALHVLYLDTGSGGFASIVGWGGSLSFHGTGKQPMTIMGWDRADSSPAADRGYGRPYIREVDGSMTLTNVRVSSLGFWSGRTGGIAWTGVTGKPSTGGASDSTFTDETYGAFLSRSSGVVFRDDLFEFNALDGLRIHRYSVGTFVISSSASRNGGNGFIVSRATRNTLLTGDVSDNNTGNGYYIDGRPLVSGASASGGSATPGSGAEIQDSAAIGNGRIGILVEGGNGTVVKADQVCAAITAIAVRYNATDAVLTGNDIRCNPRTGFSIGPAAPGTMVSGNTVSGARMGILVRNSGTVQVDNNRIIAATVFGITVRGLPSKVAGVGNAISGTGFRAVDARAQASPPALSGTNLSGWAHHAKVTFWSYLRFHPLAALWLSIAILVLAGAAWSHRRRLPPHPYPASTRWRGGTLGSLPGEMAAAQQPGRQPAHNLAAASPAPNGHRATARTAVMADHTAPMPALSGAGLASMPGGTQAPGRIVPPWAPSAEPARFSYQHEGDFDVFSPLPKAVDQL